MQVVRAGDPSEEGLVLSGGTFVTDEESQRSSFWGVASMRGKVARFDREELDGRSSMCVSTRGSPTGVAVDDQGTAYVSDVEHRAILKMDDGDNKCTTIVQDYEGKPLLGPSSIVCGSDGTVYFTDSGPLGESSLDAPSGSVFAITKDESGQILRPLALRSLAHPTGVCVSSLNDNTIFVAETLRNRILRFVKRPHGAFLGSVLHQFSGRLGPSAIACDPDNGHLYVARFDFDGVKALISVVDPSGAAGGHLRDIEIPELESSEISALTMNAETRELHVFEAASAKCIKIKL